MALLILGIILAIATFGVGAIKIYERKGKPLLSLGARFVIAPIVFLICFAIGSISVVPKGNTGVITTFGKVEDGTLEAGIHFVSPWNKLVKMDNRTQLCTAELSCFSSDIQEVTVLYSVNYKISKEFAQTIYKTIGSNYLETVMNPKIQEAVKGVIAKYTAEKLVEQRGTLSAQIEEVLRNSLSSYNIEVVNTSLANIDFTDVFTQAVEAKQVAEQNKLKAKTEQEQAILVAKAEAERKVIEAQAQADASILSAEADKKVQQINADAAEYAGKKEAAVLSNIGEQMTIYPGLVYYYYYQAWNGKLPETMLGNNTGIILDLPETDTDVSKITTPTTPSVVEATE